VKAEAESTNEMIALDLNHYDSPMKELESKYETNTSGNLNARRTSSLDPVSQKK